MIPFAENKIQKLFLVRLRYRHCCVSVIMRPTGYLTHPHSALGEIWVWDPWIRPSLPLTLNMTITSRSVASPKNSGGAKYFELKRTIVFVLGHRVWKHKTTRQLEIGEGWPWPLWPLLASPMITSIISMLWTYFKLYDISFNTNVNILLTGWCHFKF